MATEFTMILNPQEASIQLFPHMVFDDYLELYVTFEGIDLKALGHKRSGDVDFVFFNDNGEIEFIENDAARVNTEHQRIKVSDAYLYHFSRYGWVR